MASDMNAQAVSVAAPRPARWLIVGCAGVVLLIGCVWGAVEIRDHEVAEAGIRRCVNLKIMNGTYGPNTEAKLRAGIQRLQDEWYLSRREAIKVVVTLCL